MSTIETNRSWTHFRVDRRNPRYCHVTLTESLCYGDEDLLRQMISNLPDNAVKFTPRCGRVDFNLD